MIDLEQTIIKKWGKCNKNRYEQLGYTFTGYGNEFKIKIKDLPLDSNDTVYDGKKFFHNTYDYEITKRHNEIKNKYCEDNSINLIRIPYWELNEIDIILDTKLNYSHEDIV